MILLALLLQSAAPAPDTDITVIGNKLRRLQLGIDLNHGKLDACRVKVSSTDAFIDATACQSAATCLEQGMADSGKLLGCINQRIILAVAERRAQDQEGRNARN